MLRIMTYNVHRCVGTDRRTDPRRVAEAIAQVAPDIVALQELDVGRARSGGVDQARELAQLLGMNFHFHPALKVEDELFGDAIMTALPMRLVKAAALPGVFNLEPRGALWVEIEAGGRRLHVINTHLGLAAHERLAQVKALMGPEWLDHPDCADPVILLGDLNAVRRSRVYRRLSRRLRDAQLDIHKRPQRTFPSRMPMLRIDHVFCGPSVEVLRADVPRSRLLRVASDHLPLVVDFRLVEAKARSAERRRQGRQVSEAASGSPT